MKLKKILITILVAIVGLGVLGGVGMIAMGILPLGLGMHDTVSQTDGVAIGGYDVLSFYEEGPVQGSEEHSLTWNGATWYFINDEHKRLFEADPEQYAPQFGGHCALAMGTGFAVSAEHEAYAIHNDKLYLFANEDVKESFMADFDGNIKQCEANWQ